MSLPCSYPFSFVPTKISPGHAHLKVRGMFDFLELWKSNRGVQFEEIAWCSAGGRDSVKDIIEGLRRKHLFVIMPTNGTSINRTGHTGLVSTFKRRNRLQNEARSQTNVSDGLWQMIVLAFQTWRLWGSGPSTLRLLCVRNVSLFRNKWLQMTLLGRDQIWENEILYGFIDGSKSRRISKTSNTESWRLLLFSRTVCYCCQYEYIHELWGKLLINIAFGLWYDCTTTIP